MINIRLVQDAGLLRLQPHSYNGGGQREILFFDEPDQKIRQWSQKERFIEICPLFFSDQEREEFLSRYIDLIGELSQRFDSHLWWATDLSSKNRFNSNLPHYLQQILIIQKVFLERSSALRDQRDILTLIFVGVHWQVMEDVRRFFAQQGIACQVDQRAIANTAIWFGALLRRTAACAWQCFKALYKSMRARQVVGSLLQKTFLAKPSGTLIKTFIYDHSFSAQGDYHDAFFCDLIPYLKTQGEVFVFANILGDYEYCLKKIAEVKDLTIIPMEGLAGPVEIIHVHWQALTYRIKLTTPIAFAGIPITATVNNELHSTFCRIRPYQLLHFDYLRHLLKRVTVKNFITSFENNPWEKMCFLAFRQFSPQTTVTGYQHTVVPQASVNMFISKKEEAIIPHPDRLLAVGEEPCRIIRKYSPATCFSVEPSCALRFKYLFDLKPQPRQKTKTILVGMEGIFDAYHMVNYVLEQLPPESGYRVILRTHPVLPVKNFEFKLKSPLRKLVNVEVSKGLSLKEDIERCDAAIYWGSTVGLEALWVGRPVIHYDNGFVLSYDPLFECPSLKWVVKERDSLLEVLKQIDTMPEKDFLAQQQSARKYLEKYLYPIDSQALSLFLQQSSQNTV